MAITVISSVLRVRTTLPSIVVSLAIAACDADLYVLPVVSTKDAATLDSAALPGTYDVEICRGDCADPANVLRRGYLILMPDRIDWSAETDSAQRMLLLFPSSSQGNACFALDRLRAKPSSYAGLVAVGTTRWDVDASGRRLLVKLYESPDADYVAVLVQSTTPDTLRGRGMSRGSGSGLMGMDEVRATRLGPPDGALCVEAAPAEWRRMERAIDSLWRAMGGKLPFPGAA